MKVDINSSDCCYLNLHSVTYMKVETNNIHALTFIIAIAKQFFLRKK
jgi:hypothetical protein